MSLLPLGVLLLAAAAEAPPPRDPAAAEILFRDARALVERGDHVAACPRFEESLRLDPAPGTLMNLADCEEKIGKLANAWQRWLEASEKLAAIADDRAAYAKQRLDALAPRVPRLVLRPAPNAPADLRVERDGVVLSAASFGIPLPVDPGEHPLVVSAPGFTTNQKKVFLAEGETREVIVSPGIPLVAAGGSSDTGWIVGSLGAASLLTGSVTGALALSALGTVRDHCDAQRRCDPTGLDAAASGKTLSTVSIVTLAAGAVGMAAGAYLLLDEPSPASSPEPAVQDPQMVPLDLQASAQ